MHCQLFDTVWFLPGIFRMSLTFPAVLVTGSVFQLMFLFIDLYSENISFYDIYYVLQEAVAQAFDRTVICPVNNRKCRVKLIHFLTAQQEHFAWVNVRAPFQLAIDPAIPFWC